LKKVIVCGAIANKGISKIRKIQTFLKEKGFHVIDQISNKDYSKIKDFRGKKNLAEEIVRQDLDFIKESDVVVALIDRPSFGVAMEIYFAKIMGKRIVIMSKKRVPSPWPIAFSDQIIRNEEQLVLALKELQNHF
jgi:nucleoside 2-deoxyribosyltransferase